MLLNQQNIYKLIFLILYMEKKSVKISGFFVLSILIINLFVGFVSADSFADKIAQGVSSAGGFPAGDFFEGTGFAKFLLFLLVALIVFGISEMLPFIGKENKTWVSIGISIVVGILATFYLKDTEIYSILLSYGALGITLTVLVPFLLIFFMSIKLREDGYGFFSKVIWLIFGVVLVFRWVFADSGACVAGKICESMGSFGNWVYPITIGGVLIMFLWGDKMVESILKGKVDDSIDKMKRHRKMRQALTKEEEKEAMRYMNE